MAASGLRCWAWAFSSCGEQRLLFVAVRGLLLAVASLVAEHRLQTRRLSSCGARAQLLRSMWDLPGPGPEHVSPALAGGFLTTAPPGKSSASNLNHILGPRHYWNKICQKSDSILVKHIYIFRAYLTISVSSNIKRCDGSRITKQFEFTEWILFREFLLWHTTLPLWGRYFCEISLPGIAVLHICWFVFIL